MSNVTVQRKNFIASARVIGILLVVFGHSFPFEVAIPSGLNRAREVIYLFHMPLFVLISGYLAAGSTRGAKEYIVRRAAKLLIPYFALSLAAYLPKILVQKFLNDSVELDIWWLIRSELIPRANVWGHFWYLPVIFILGAFSAVARKRLKQNRCLLGFALAGAYLLLWLPQTTGWFALEDLRKNLFYYILGFALVCGGLEHKLKSVWLLLAVPVALALYRVGFPQKTLIPLLMIGGVLCLGMHLDLTKNRLLCRVERYSYTIYLLSWPAQAVVEVALNRVLHLPLVVVMACMFTAGLAVPLIFVRVVMWMEKKVSVDWLKMITGM